MKQHCAFYNKDNRTIVSPLPVNSKRRINQLVRNCLLPRRSPCGCHPRLTSCKLYLAVLLLLTAGDIELNPGPVINPSMIDDTQLPRETVLTSSAVPHSQIQPLSVAADSNEYRSFYHTHEAEVNCYKLNRANALKRKNCGLSRNDFTVTKNDNGRQVTILCNTALYELLKEQLMGYLEMMGVTVIGQRVGYDQNGAAVKQLFNLVFQFTANSKRKITVTMYHTTSSILMQSSGKPIGENSVSMSFLTEYMLPFLEKLADDESLPLLKKSAEGENSICPGTK